MQPPLFPLSRNNHRGRSKAIMNYDALPTPSSKPEATDFLQTLLNKNLRVGTTDGRMFWGSFKCTDSDCNLVLQHTYEYRPPSPNSNQPPPRPQAQTPSPKKWSWT
ncbi:hypothetical protein QC763_109745 [Podospora pseudopauciseta]|uniref:Sm domain-containing protein n=2 Tax=Podospora TaxID=5144 RepID=A0ABR0HYL9_9PEZI|nr:hypothetical protein QC763_109745 [Podospora pseudopauciseta]KAK4681704.1 hypothetical protein QC764_109745 [Podospora pseudoanserina]